MSCAACGTRLADPDRGLEAAWASTFTNGGVQGQSRSASSLTKDGLTSRVASAVRLKRVFSQNLDYWSDLEVTLT